MCLILLYLTHNITPFVGTSFSLFFKKNLLERDVFVPLYESFQRKRKILLSGVPLVWSACAMCAFI